MDYAGVIGKYMLDNDFLFIKFIYWLQPTTVSFWSSWIAFGLHIFILLTYFVLQSNYLHCFMDSLSQRGNYNYVGDSSTWLIYIFEGLVYWLTWLHSTSWRW